MIEIEEFIKKLSNETHLSNNNASILVKFIYEKIQTLDTAYKIYDKYGVPGLEFYVNQLTLGFIY